MAQLLPFHEPLQFLARVQRRSADHDVWRRLAALAPSLRGRLGDPEQKAEIGFGQIVDRIDELPNACRSVDLRSARAA